MRLDGKVAFITGASAGIGAAVAGALDGVGVFVLTRPRNHRILEAAFRPVTESSWR